MESISLTHDSVVDSVRAGIRRAKAVSLDDGEITESTAFWGAGEPGRPGLAFDSLDFLELVVFLEEQFGWSIPDTEIDVNECQTVGDLASLIIKHLHGES